MFGFFKTNKVAKLDYILTLGNTMKFVLSNPQVRYNGSLTDTPENGNGMIGITQDEKTIIHKYGDGRIGAFSIMEVIDLNTDTDIQGFIDITSAYKIGHKGIRNAMIFKTISSKNHQYNFIVFNIRYPFGIGKIVIDSSNMIGSEQYSFEIKE